MTQAPSATDRSSDTDLRISGLVKSFGGHVAVDGVDISASPGQCVALLGPSGCGKTTTLRCVAGLESPDDGRIEVGSDVLWSPEVAVPPEHRGMGMVFQSYALWPHLSVTKNVEYPLSLRRATRSGASARAAAALEMVGMSGHGNKLPSQLSGGQQQRVALARSVVAEPRIMLFDEPLSNLDRALRDEMRVELRRIISTLGITSLYVTHDQAEAFAIADTVIVMRDGRIEQQGTPQEIFMRPATEFVARFLGAESTLGGRVVGTGDGVSRVELAEIGTEVDVTGELPMGTDAVIAVHPERIRAVPVGGPSAGSVGRRQSIAAVIEDIAFLGGMVEIVAASGPHRVKVRLRTVDAWDGFAVDGLQVGGAVRLEAERRDLVAFAAPRTGAPVDPAPAGPVAAGVGGIR